MEGAPRGRRRGVLLGPGVANQVCSCGPALLWPSRVRLTPPRARSASLPLPVAVCRELVFVDAANELSATNRYRQRELDILFDDATGLKWLDWLWSCTGVVDALAVAVAAAAAHGVAPDAAVAKSAFAKRVRALWCCVRV